MTHGFDLPPPTAASRRGDRSRDAWLRAEWSAVSVREIRVRPQFADAARPLRLEALVHLGRLLPADVRVDAGVAGDPSRHADGGSPLRLWSSRSYRNGSFVFETPLDALEAHGATGFPVTVVVRVRPAALRDGAVPPGPVTRVMRLDDAGALARPDPGAPLPPSPIHSSGGQPC